MTARRGESRARRIESARESTDRRIDRARRLTETDIRSFVRSRAVAYMMYGFGDSKEPDPASVELVEDMLVDYLVNVGHRSMEVAERRGRMQTEDLLYVIRNDRKKFARVDELLEMNAKLKDARRNFDLHDPAAVLAQQRADEEAARRREAEARAEAEAEAEADADAEEE